jgi:hypothetical protein
LHSFFLGFPKLHVEVRFFFTFKNFVWVHVNNKMYSKVRFTCLKLNFGCFHWEWSYHIHFHFHAHPLLNIFRI